MEHSDNTTKFNKYFWLFTGFVLGVIICTSPLILTEYLYSQFDYAIARYGSGTTPWRESVDGPYYYLEWIKKTDNSDRAARIVCKYLENGSYEQKMTSMVISMDMIEHASITLPAYKRILSSNKLSTPEKMNALDSANEIWIKFKNICEPAK